MHARLDELETLAADFEQNATGQARLLISVVVVGFKLSYAYNKEKIDELISDKQECSDGTTMTREFPISQSGELINIIERIHKIAEKKRVVVLGCDDW